MIDCKEAAYLVDKGQFEKLTFWKKLNLKFHSLMCDICRKYAKDSHALSHIVKHADLNTSKLSEKEKVQIKEELAK